MAPSGLFGSIKCGLFLAAVAGGLTSRAAHATVYTDALGALTPIVSSTVTVPANTGVDVTFTLASPGDIDLVLNISDPSKSLAGTTWTLGSDVETVTFVSKHAYTVEFVDPLAAGPYTIAFSTAIPKGDTIGVNGTVSAVPEPATWGMMVLGFFGVGFVAYRRKALSSAFRIA